MRIKLTNSFHNTETHVLFQENTSPEEAWEEIQIQAHEEYLRGIYGPARRRIHRIHKSLCGQKHCACGTFRP